MCARQKACRHVTFASSILCKKTCRRSARSQTSSSMSAMLELKPGLSTRVTPGLNNKWKIFVHKTIRSKNQLHRSLLSDSNWYTFHHSLVGLHIWRVSGCPQPRWSFARSKWVGEPDYQSPVWQAQPLSTSIGTCSCPSHHAMANLVVNRLKLPHSNRTL